MGHITTSKGDVHKMKKLFFFIFPLALMFGFLPFAFSHASESDNVYTVNASCYGFKNLQANYNFVDEQNFEQYESDENFLPKVIKRAQPEPAELLQTFPFGYIDNASKVLPVGICFI